MSAGVLHAPGSGRISYIVNDRHTIKLSSTDGAGRLGISEMWLDPGAGAPPHRHAHEDEFFYVIEGQVTFVDGDTTRVLAAGESIFLPRGSLHGFSNRSDTPAKVFLTLTPSAGFEAFCRECGAQWAGDGPPPPSEIMAAIDRMMARASSFGIEMVPGHTPTRFGAPACERKSHNVLGDPVDILVSGAESAGRLTVVHVIGRPGGGPPPHLHDRADEAFFVLTGAIEVLLDGKWVELSAGGFAYVPPGQVHSYRNRSPHPATFLVLSTPGGLDEMFRELGDLNVPPEMSRVADICRRRDTRFI